MRDGGCESYIFDHFRRERAVWNWRTFQFSSRAHCGYHLCQKFWHLQNKITMKRENFWHIGNFICLLVFLEMPGQAVLERIWGILQRMENSARQGSAFLYSIARSIRLNYLNFFFTVFALIEVMWLVLLFPRLVPPRSWIPGPRLIYVKELEFFRETGCNIERDLLYSFGCCSYEMRSP